jgi:enoyl-CoA hydratase/carnithine racemase
MRWRISKPVSTFPGYALGIGYNAGNRDGRSLNMPASPATAPIAGNEPIVLREDAERVAVLVLNRPEARNALSEAMLAALSDRLATIAGDETIRAVVIAANGPAFCSGHDLRELTARRSDPDGGQAFFQHMFERCGKLMRAVVALPQPVIAVVQGAATAAGCELVASCDLAVASAQATFGTPGVNIGLFCTTPAIPIARNIPRKHALDMLLTGDMMSADDACRFGLVSRVVAPGTERAQAMKIARQIASKSALTMRIGKKAFHQQIEMSLADAYRLGARAMVDNMLTHDADEGIRAFLDKRPARWQDR